ncbi:MAG: T9SS type A sorting domain-containing protein [Bacteroidales bacterium]|nr:T9SS type A sorting domain-containing protein [Bacteroidales bacterium]
MKGFIIVLMIFLSPDMILQGQASVTDTPASVQAKSAKLLWADVGIMSETSGVINMSNLDGSHVQTLIDSLYMPAGLAVDNSVSPPEIYISERGRSRIIKIAANGAFLAELITDIPGIHDIELDLGLRKIVFISDTYSLDAVSRADMDGLNSNIEDLYISTGTSYHYLGLSIDPPNERVYWIRNNSACADVIYGMNYDKTNLQNIIVHPKNKLIGPWDIDVYDNKIYWTDCGLNEDIIYKANLDGSGIDTVIQDVNTLFFAIDASDSKIYWNDNQVMGRSNLDGTERDTLVTGIGSQVYGLAIAYNIPDTITETDEPVALTQANTFDYFLEQNHPNPFMETTIIEFSLPLSEEVCIEFIDMQGRIIESDTRAYAAGNNSFELDLKRKIQPGIYIYRMRTSVYTDSRMCIVR